jgi:hypothetical protein
MVEEDGNKKRRNLMVTSVAVLIAAFLGLKMPALAINELHLDARIAPPWKVWMVVLLILDYQVWRFYTDDEFTQQRAKAKKQRTAAADEAFRRRLLGALREHLAGSSTRGFQFIVRLPETLTGARWKDADLYFSPQDAAGALKAPPELANIGKDSSFGYMVQASSGMRNSSASFTYQVSRWALRRIELASDLMTNWKSQAYQDISYPLFFAGAAIVVCLWRLAQFALH